MNWYKQAQSESGWQKGWTDNFGDIQRYVYDAYQCSVYITKLDHEKITVSTSMSHMQFGHVMWQDFWRFKQTQIGEAQKVFASVKSAVQKVFKQFRSNDIPNNLLHSYLREEVRHIGAEYKPKTRVPAIDWAAKIDGSPDWRSNIYGKRYPISDGF